MIKFNSSAIITKLGNETVVTLRNDPHGNNMIIFNSTGKIIIDCLKAGMTVEEIKDRLKALTGNDSTQLDKDVDSFIEELKSYGILEE